MRGDRIMDMAIMRADAQAKAKVIAKAVLFQGGDTAGVNNLVQPPAEITPPQQRLWLELLVQGIQRQLRSHNVTV